MPQSLEDKIQAHGGDVYDMLYNSPGAPFGFPHRAEFSNWREEQEAWSRTAIFQNMSFHMTEHVIEGPDTYRLLSDLGINSMDGFGPMQAKQYVVCNHDGMVIGDVILTCEEDNRVMLVGKPIVGNWVHFNLESGDYDATLVAVHRPSPNLADRAHYRFQVQGPNADKILEACHGGALPEIGFFKMGHFTIAGHRTTALNHRMSGAPGYEFWGPSEHGDAIKAAIFEAGQQYDLTEIGARNYSVTAVESGWYGSPVPAIYTGDAMKDYRKWLPAMSMEGGFSIGGSFQTGNLEDHYVTPYDIGYGFMIKFDHDFIGRTALENLPATAKRKKVRLIWNTEDTDRVMTSLHGDERYKFMEMPTATYATGPMDRLQDGDEPVGHSNYPVYSMHSRAWISLACVDPAVAIGGKTLNLVWGEPDGGSAKPSVERHVQTRIRVSVDTQPIKRA